MSYYVIFNANFQMPHKKKRWIETARITSILKMHIKNVCAAQLKHIY